MNMVAEKWLGPIGDPAKLKRVESVDLWAHRCPTKGAMLQMIRGLPCPWCSERGREGDRRRMRQGAKEVLTVLARARPARLTFEQISQHLPGVSSGILHCRLSKLASREDISRCGSKFRYTYSLPEGSTFRAT